MKKLYIFRGLPGSGKSTLAAKRAALVIEPDMFRYDADMKYVFNSAENDEVYRNTDHLLRFAADMGIRCLALAATNVKLDAVRCYAETGLAFGYDVTVVECRGNYGNPHGVPPSVIAKMAKEFEPLTADTATEWGVHLETVDQDTVQETSRRWVVTYVDRGDTCDGKARILGIYESRAKAISELEADMHEYAKKHRGAKINMADWSADLGDDAGCDWNVEGLPA